MENENSVLLSRIRALEEELRLLREEHEELQEVYENINKECFRLKEENYIANNRIEENVQKYERLLSKSSAQ